MGLLVGAVEAGGDLAWPLAGVGTVFVLLQVLPPLHLAAGQNLGSSAAAWLYDELTVAAWNRPASAIWKIPELAGDLTMARDFDLGISGPPLAISMDFIAAGLVELLAGLTAVAILFAYAWWAPLLLGGAWLATHWLLRESAVWKDRQTDAVRAAQRHADYAYRLAVDAPAAKELRLFGLADWIIERFRRHRRRLHDLRWEATKLRERPVATSLLLVLAANAVVFWSLAADVTSGALPLDRLVMFAGAAIAASMIAFGGLSWALDGAGAPAAAVLRLHEAMAPRGALTRGSRSAAGLPAREIRFSGVRFAYPSGPGTPVLDGFDLTIPAGSSLAIVGQNGAGKTTLAKLLCRFYEPQEGAVEVDGVDLRELDVDSWRERITAVFQDFARFELPLADNVAPAGAPEAVVRDALAAGRGGGPRRPRHHPGPGLRRRDGAVRRTVAAGGAGPGARRGALRRRHRPARRADRAARRAGRSRDLRTDPAGDPRDDDHPHLPPLLHRPPRGPDLRPRARPGHRAGRPRGADGAGRTLPDDVRPAGAALRGRGRDGARCPRLTPPASAATTCPRRCRRCGGR